MVPRSFVLWLIACVAATSPPGQSSSDVLIQALRSGDAQRQSEALTEIRRLGPEAAATVPALTELLQEERTRPSRSLRIVAALGAIGAPAGSALPTLVRGETISAFQVPLLGRRVRLTVPIVLTRQTGPDACAYTQCEAWMAERIGALQAWIRDLREESDSDVIVVSREPSDGVAALPDVAAFIHLPYDGLPKQ
jgi:hypothetical protein